jgi:hypothetical protein
MSTRGAGRAPRRARQAALTALAASAALSLAACGSDDFKNEPPRAARVLEVAARVDQRQVVVSPGHFGAGLVIFNVANLSDSPVTFTLSGPKDVATEEIAPGAPADLKVELPQGNYQASAGEGASAQPATLRVGPDRPSSRDELLLP